MSRAIFQRLMIFFSHRLLELLDRDVVLAQEALEAAAFFAGGAGGQADVLPSHAVSTSIR